MRLIKLSFVVCALLVISLTALAQGDMPIRIPGGTKFHRLNMVRTPTDKLQPALLGSAIPTYSYSVVSPVDGKTYSGQIIGVNPSVRPAHATVIPVIVIPVRLIFQYSSSKFIFDPTVGDPGCLGTGRTALSLTQESPLFNDTRYVFGGTNVGNTQYIDAFQRANFWKEVSASGGGIYHTLLGFTPMPLQTVTVSSANSGTPNGTVFSLPGECGTNSGVVNAPGLLGVMNLDFFNVTTLSLMRKLGVTPDSFVLFLLYNAAMAQGNPTFSGNCCILGYHTITGAQTGLQTYGVASFEGRNQTQFEGVADTSVLSHELGEWINDPGSQSATPPWGQLPFCSSVYEVGDPLNQTLMPEVKMPNGFTYHLQELAFFSWFYRISPSDGVNGWYSNNGTFMTSAGPICQ